MGKFNLSEAAKEVLSANVAGKKSGQDKPQKLAGDVAYGTAEAGDIGTQVTQTTDAAPQATKGVPTATAPGATPPVGSEPMKKLAPQPQEQGSAEQPEGKKGGQKMAKNPGATFQSYGEETESEEEVLAEEEMTLEEAMAKIKKMKKKMKAMKEAAEDTQLVKQMINQETMKEDISALLSGENLSEEFVSKATTIFEAAVVARAEEVIATAEAQLHEEFESAIEQIKEELAAKIDDYLNYMVEEWMKENEIAIESGLRAEIVEDFMGGLRNLFVEHYIDIPADKVNVVEELTAKVEELEASLNEQMNRSVELTKELNEQKKFEAIYTACEGLSQTQVEKLKSLAENVEFTTEEEFAAKLKTLKESYFKADVKVADSSALDDEVQIEEEAKKPTVSADPLIDQVVKTISQSLK